MRPERILRLEHGRLAGTELRPVNLAVFQIVQVQLENGWLLIAQRVFGVFGPVVGGCDDDSLGKRLLPRCSKEAVDVAFVDPLIRGEALALDGMVFARPSGLGDVINARVFA